MTLCGKDCYFVIMYENKIMRLKYGMMSENTRGKKIGEFSPKQRD